MPSLSDSLTLLEKVCHISQALLDCSIDDFDAMQAFMDDRAIQLAALEQSVAADASLLQVPSWQAGLLQLQQLDKLIGEKLDRLSAQHSVEMRALFQAKRALASYKVPKTYQDVGVESQA